MTISKRRKRNSKMSTGIFKKNIFIGVKNE